VKNRPRSIVPPDEQLEMVRLFLEEKLAPLDIANKHFYSVSTIRKILYELHGLDPNSRTPTTRQVLVDHEYDRLCAELYRDGLGTSEIAEVAGGSRKRAENALHRQGVQMRTRGQYERMAYVRGRRGSLMMKLLAELQKCDEPVTSSYLEQAVGSNGKRWTTHRALNALVNYGLVESAGFQGTARIWRATHRDQREVLAELDPNGSFVARKQPDLPTAPLLRVIDEMIDNELRLRSFDNQIREITSGNGAGVGPVAAVSQRVGVSERTINRWRRVVRYTLFEVADGVITSSPYLWWEVFSEETCRLPEVGIQMVFCSPKTAVADDDRETRRKLLHQVALGNIDWREYDGLRHPYYRREPKRYWAIGDGGVDEQALQAAREAFDGAYVDAI
jgi:hypothetical protein